MLTRLSNDQLYPGRERGGHNEGISQEGYTVPTDYSDGIMRLCILFVLPTYVLVQGCASTLPPPKSTYTFNRGCVSSKTIFKHVAVSEVETTPPSEEIPGKGEAAKSYSPVAIDIAAVLNVLPLLNRLALLEHRQKDTDETERTRRKLINRLQLATLEVSSLVAELECEVHRADEVQDRLKNAQYTRSMSQTLLSVVIGGLVNVVTGGLGIATGAGDTAHIVSIAGGTLEVLFGTSANFTKVRQEFSHPHNHLARLWIGEDVKDYYSPRIWQFLTTPNSRDLEGRSLRDVMLEAWHEQSRIGQPGSRRAEEREQLLFSTGGLYDADDLHIREAMLQQLESSIQLMHQDLETLLREVLMHQAMEEATGSGEDSLHFLPTDGDAHLPLDRSHMQRFTMRVLSAPSQNL